MEIIKQIFESFLLCPYKAFRILKNESGVKSDFELIQSKIAENYRQEALCRLYSDLTSRETDVLLNQRISSQGLSAFFHAVERIPGKSSLGSFHYIPVLFTPSSKPSKNDGMAAAFDSLLLENFQVRRPAYAKLIFGKNFKIKKIKPGNQIKVKRILEQIKLLAANPAPRLMLNRHCQICEFKNSCEQQAIEKDNLSLLRGISAKEVETQSKKGIFTVTQYSHTFRARRRFKKSYPFNLRAFALREKKIHVYGSPMMPAANVQIYLDVEGDPGRDFYYLIGLTIINGISEEHFSFWADNEAQEAGIFIQFLKTLEKYSDFKIFHYGSYETRFLKKVEKTTGSPYSDLIQKMLASLINVLSLIHTHIFFPTYSNGLKDIAAHLGFKWTMKNASGIQSLVWRYEFEMSSEEMFKTRLIQYNLEDCLALKRVVEFITELIGIRSSPKSEFSSAVVHVEDLKKESTYKWGVVDFVSKDLKRINDCGYFDYQRERVFIRNLPHLRTQHEFRKRAAKRRHKINKKIVLETRRNCPRCQRILYRHGNYSKRVIDLKFSSAGGGIKRWIINYRANRARCPICHNFKKIFGATKIWAWFDNLGRLSKYRRTYPVF